MWHDHLTERHKAEALYTLFPDAPARFTGLAPILVWGQLMCFTSVNQDKSNYQSDVTFKQASGQWNEMKAKFALF